MKEIRIKNVTMQDFKGQIHRSVDFPATGNAVVSGANGSGKTTIADAFYWVFFDKDYSLKSNPDIRPDDGRECVPRVDIELSVDDVSLVISKFQKRSARESKTTGKVTVSTTNGYELNGVPKTERDLKKSLFDIGIDVESLLPLVHLEVFTSQKKDDARKVLFSMEKQLTDFEVAESLPECGKLLPLLRDYKLEEILAMQKASKKKADEQLKTIPEMIVGMERVKVDYDTEALERQKAAIELRLSTLENMLIEDGNAKEEAMLQAKVAECRAEMSGVVSKATQALNLRRQEAKFAFDDAMSDLRSLRSHECRMQEDLKETRDELTVIAEQIAAERVRYAEAQKAKWDDSELRKVSEQIIPDGITICPTCGQELPEEMAKDAVERFKRRKQERIEQLTAEKEAWESRAVERLKEIAESGNRKLAKKKELAQAEEQITNALEGIAVKVMEAEASAEARKKEYEAMPKTPELSEDDEYMCLVDQLAKLDESMESVRNSTTNLSETEAEISRLKENLTEIDRKLGTIDHNKFIESEIAKMKAAQKKYAQESANAQEILDQAAELGRRKNELFQDEVSKHFSGVKVKLFDFQKNGEVVDVCDWYAKNENGEWKKLNGMANTALAVKAKIAIVNGLQRFFDISFPAFVDFAAELDSQTVAGIRSDCQLVFLKVSEQGNLSVQEVG